MSDRFSNSSAAAQAARNAHNAAITNSKPPVQRSNVPNPAQTPLNLPKMTVLAAPSRDPGLPSRIQQPAPQPKPVK
jgi:hypothetical protein